MQIFSRNTTQSRRSRKTTTGSHGPASHLSHTPIRKELNASDEARRVTCKKYGCFAYLAGLAEPTNRVGRLRIGVARRMIVRDGQPVVLGRKEWALLAVLMRHAGRVVTQPQLMNEVWGPGHEKDIHYLRILAAKLRAKLGDDATTPKYIQTETGVGLRFLEA